MNIIPVSDKMAKKLMDLCMDKLKSIVTDAYNDVTTVRFHDGVHDDYSINSELIVDTTAKIQTLLEENFNDYELPENIRSAIETLETKTERIALQNITNEQLVNSGTLKCNDAMDRELLKNLLMSKL